ncbi:MAG: hypothetical protein JWQ81_7854 [Amycolatopsis sp.]|jgi:predicted SnoaL-like aldol condensation-catalyzing enzyme|uniref:nuclear transport factor 2 family protein n=1 Tax=Amycolatopsis sp. TaxID=37632 RepID=UPI00260CDA47|nr:nuclear transport factor 2 family protein [Amycolatopsis sp.]MCU1687115.1 hypothetical protein [Amycolatopsis sp.]
MTDLQLLGTDVFERWTALWNGDFDVTDALLAPDFRIHFAGANAAARGDDVRGPDAFAAFVTAFREAKPDLRFRFDGPPIGQGDRIASIWSVRQPGGLAKSGIDVLRLVDGQIVEVWSVTGEVTFGE